MTSVPTSPSNGPRVPITERYEFNCSLLDLMLASIFYNLARVNALAASAVRQDVLLEANDRDRLADQYAVRSLELLGHAREAGFFQVREKREKLSGESDLEALRGRPDYQAFVRGLPGRATER